MKTIFVVCQHGDEQIPLKVIEEKFAGKISYLVANKRAIRSGKRYVESDLNRSFPGKINGTLEERLAQKLVMKLKKYDQVVDIHTATCETPLFAILTKVTKKHLELVSELGVQKVVVMQKSIASGKALIDFVSVGVSIECGHEKNKITQIKISKMLKYYLTGKSLKKTEFYVVDEILKSSSKLPKLPEKVQSFRKTKLNGRTFYPILARETHYKGVLCLMARKVRLKELLMLE